MLPHETQICFHGGAYHFVSLSLRKEVGTELLQSDLCADVFQLLLQLFSLVLGDAFLDCLGSSLDDSLSVSQAQAGDLADSLDDLNLLGAEVLQNDVELGLLLSSGSSAASS